MPVDGGAKKTVASVPVAKEPSKLAAALSFYYNADSVCPDCKKPITRGSRRQGDTVVLTADCTKCAWSLEIVLPVEIDLYVQNTDATLRTRQELYQMIRAAQDDDKAEFDVHREEYAAMTRVQSELAGVIKEQENAINQVKSRMFDAYELMVELEYKRKQAFDTAAPADVSYEKFRAAPGAKKYLSVLAEYVAAKKTYREIQREFDELVLRTAAGNKHYVYQPAKIKGDVPAVSVTAAKTRTRTKRAKPTVKGGGEIDTPLTLTIPTGTTTPLDTTTPLTTATPPLPASVPVVPQPLGSLVSLNGPVKSVVSGGAVARPTSQKSDDDDILKPGLEAGLEEGLEGLVVGGVSAPPVPPADGTDDIEIGGTTYSIIKLE